MPGGRRRTEKYYRLKPRTTPPAAPLARVVTEKQLWPSRQDFIIDAVREKLDRISDFRDASSRRR